MKLTFSPVRIFCLLNVVFALIVFALMCLKESVYAAAGATTSLTTYKVEAGTLGGGAVISSPTSALSTQYSSPQLKASGHAFVLLTNGGDSVTWTNNTGQGITTINLRYSISDANGIGQTSTISLYVNGVYRQLINVNSKQTWAYEGPHTYNSFSQTTDPTNNPYARVFWDEAPASINGAAIPPGATMTIDKDLERSA